MQQDEASRHCEAKQNKTKRNKLLEILEQTRAEIKQDKVLRNFKASKQTKKRNESSFSKCQSKRKTKQNPDETKTHHEILTHTNKTKQKSNNNPNEPRHSFTERRNNQTKRNETQLLVRQVYNNETATVLSAAGPDQWPERVAPRWGTRKTREMFGILR